MRVLVVTPHSPLGLGGVERHVLETSTRLAAAGVEIRVLYADAEHRKPTSGRVGGVELRAVRAWPPGRDWYFAPGLWRELGERRWDVVHVQSYHTLVAPLAMSRALNLSLPYCVTFHAGGHSSPWRNQIRTAQLRILRPLLARAARLIAVARFEIDLYASRLGIPESNFVLIPNGIDSIAVPSGGAGEPVPGLLASIGRLERYKGHQRVISALPAVLERRPDARLMIVGTGPYEPELRRLVGKLGLEERVEFTSVAPEDREAMMELLGRVWLVVLMSEFETHPLSVLEAAAARRRVLVSDRAGLLELAEDGLARAAPLDGPPERLGGYILEELDSSPVVSAPALPTWDECAASLLALYETVSGESGSLRARPGG